MTIRSESRIDMAASPEAVFGYLADVARWPEWTGAILECRVSDGSEVRAGSQLQQRVRSPGGSRNRVLNVTAADPPRALAFAGQIGPSPIRWGFQIDPQGPIKTSLMLWIEADQRGFMRAMPGSLMKSMFAKVNRRELVAIKSMLESGNRT